jgi:hypothetical protein
MCCGLIQELSTGRFVDIPLEKLPAEVAIQKLMSQNGVLYRHPKKKRKVK